MRVRTVALAAALMVLAQPADARRQPRKEDPASSTAAIAQGKTIAFAQACAPGERITIAATGDLLFHRPLEQEALTPSGNYRDFWKPVTSIIANADLAYANFEGAAADGVTNGLDIVKDPGREWNNRVYTAQPMVLSYNYHPSLIDDLINTGFDVVSTANNHALDRGAIGIDRTVANFEKRGLAFSGTRVSDAAEHPFSVVTTVKGHNVAWLACTFDTNGFPDRHDQVLHCFSQRDAVLAEIKRLASDPQIDAVMFTPHWGIEGSPTPEKRQRDLAQAAVEAGATAVVGTHPHVQGPWEKLSATDGREGLVIYSTGNFISNQRHPEQRMGEIALIELTQEPGAKKMRVTAAGFIQTYVDITAVHRVTEAPRSMASRPMPAGNRVFGAELPKLPRTCDAGQSVTESWGAAPPVTVALLPLPPPKPVEPKSGAVIRDLAVVTASAAAMPSAKLVLAAVQPVVRSTQPSAVSALASLKAPQVNAKLAGIAALPTDGWALTSKAAGKTDAVATNLAVPAKARPAKTYYVDVKLAGVAGLPTDGWVLAKQTIAGAATGAGSKPEKATKTVSLASTSTAPARKRRTPTVEAAKGASFTSR